MTAASFGTSIIWWFKSLSKCLGKILIFWPHSIGSMWFSFIQIQVVFTCGGVKTWLKSVFSSLECRSMILKLWALFGNYRFCIHLFDLKSCICYFSLRTHGHYGATIWWIAKFGLLAYADLSPWSICQWGYFIAMISLLLFEDWNYLLI